MLKLFYYKYTTLKKADPSFKLGFVWFFLQCTVFNTKELRHIANESVIISVIYIRKDKKNKKVYIENAYFNNTIKDFNLSKFRLLFNNLCQMYFRNGYNKVIKELEINNYSVLQLKTYTKTYTDMLDFEEDLEETFPLTDPKIILSKTKNNN